MSREPDDFSHFHVAPRGSSEAVAQIEIPTGFLADFPREYYSLNLRRRDPYERLLDHAGDRRDMVEAERRDGLATLTPTQIETGERIFGDWLSEHWADMREDGALGDVAQLLTRLRVVFS